MHYFSICLDLSAKVCIVIGGGKVAERKVQSLLACGATITVVSPDLTAGLEDLATREKINLIQRPYQEGDLLGAFLVIAATDDPQVQQQVHEEALRRNLLLNVADVPELCNFILPATLRRGDLAIAVSTGGRSPALARRIKEGLEEDFCPEYGEYVALLGLLRPFILGKKLSHGENKRIFQSLLHDGMVGWIQHRQWDKIKKHIESIIGNEAAEACVNALVAGQQPPGKPPRAPKAGNGKII